MEENKVIHTPEQPPLTPDASPEEIAKYAVSVLDSKKARNIRLLHTEQQTILADYFVICSGTSSTQIRSLADEIEFKLSAFGITPSHIEGADTGIWVLQDFDNVIVHIFNSESRDFYKLDKLYMDTTEEDISALLTEN